MPVIVTELAAQLSEEELYMSKLAHQQYIQNALKDIWMFYGKPILSSDFHGAGPWLRLFGGEITELAFRKE